MPINAIPVHKEHVTLHPDQNLAEALALMLKRQINHVAICDQDAHFIGLLSTNAILRALIPPSAMVSGGLSSLRFTGDALRILTSHLHELERLRVGDFVTTDVPKMLENDPILDAAKLLSESSTPLPIIGQDGRFIGVLSRRALLTYLLEKERA